MTYHYYYAPFNLHASIDTDAGTGGSNGSRVHPAGTLVAVPATAAAPEAIRKPDGTYRLFERVTRRRAERAFGVASIRALVVECEIDRLNAEGESTYDLYRELDALYGRA